MIYALILIAAVWLAIAKLKRPYLGCKYALAGSVGIGGVALLAGGLFLYLYKAPPPKNDSDWSVVPFLCLFYVPVGGFLAGMVGGVGYAHWKERG